MVEETPLDIQFKKLWETEKYGTEGAESKLGNLSEDDRFAQDMVDTW